MRLQAPAQPLKLALTLLLSLIISACASQVKYPLFSSVDNKQPTSGNKILKHAKAKQGQNEQQLSIQYLGVGGHLFQFGDSQLLTGPSISNPSFFRVGPFIPVASDKEKIDRFMPDVSAAEIILVGHAHYDHLMDVPYVMQKHSPQAVAYGSNTMANLISATVGKDRVRALNNNMAQGQQAGQWIYNQSENIRFMAIESFHAPHFLGVKVMQGQVDEAQDELPWHAFGWKEGQTLAFLIDFLSPKGKVLHRIYYQDSASEAPLGLVPDSLLAEKAVDIAILCPAAFAQVDNYPEYMMQNTQAQHYILGHWEDFFANQQQAPQKFIRATNQDDFFARFKAQLKPTNTWAMPELFSRQVFAPQGKLLNP